MLLGSKKSLIRSTSRCDGWECDSEPRPISYDNRMKQLVLSALLVLLFGAGAGAGQAKPPVFEPIPAPPDVAKPPADATKTASGLASKVLQPGTGTTTPKPDDFVTVHYTGWTTDGKMFDSSYARNAASTFPVGKVIKGWGEGVQLMVVGEKRRLWIPQELAYAGQSGRPQGMLVFDVELLEISPSPTNPPPDVAAPPSDAQKTASGLIYKVLRPGPAGGTRPNKTSRVTVHYSGWTTDGKLFDSSVMRGQTASFGLTDVIEGWTEGLQLMVPGEKTRFWIPERLAYKGQGTGPKGMLVFDVELTSFR
jgi:peptidylprolyl isomerase